MMKLWPLAFVFVSSLACAEVASGLPPLKLPPVPALLPVAIGLMPKTTFALDGVTVRDVVQLIYGEGNKREFVLSDEVVNDQRLVSFRMDYTEANLREFLKFQGYQIVSRGNVDFVSKAGVDVPENAQMFVYTPKNRDADYLLRICRDFVKGKFFGDGVNVQTASHTPDATTQKLVQTADRIVFSGDDKQVAKLKGLLAKLDVSPGQVLIEAAVYEVSTTDSDGSSLQLIGSVLKSKFGVQIGGPVMTNSITLSFGGLSGVLSALSSDVRFKTVSRSNVFAKNGVAGALSVGEQVPVLGAVTVAANGLSQQSVNMVQSGVSLSATPTIMGDVIDVNVMQQISSFVATTTGVNTTPTLNNRQLSTTVSMHDGDTIILGGLRQKTVTDTKSGVSFFDHLFKNKASAETEIVVIMRVSLTRSICDNCTEKMAEN